MKEIGQVETIYDNLPRYVKKPVDPSKKDRCPLSIIHNLELNNRRFTFVISPATIIKDDGKTCRYYPGDREHLIEQALVNLATDENPNYEKSNLTLFFSLFDLYFEVLHITRNENYKVKDLQLGLKILAGSSFNLIEGSGSETIFHPIKQCVNRRIDGEICYLIEFSPFFFSQDRIFNESDYCGEREFFDYG